MATSVITGATSGIGAAFVHYLAAAGHGLVLVARNEAQLRQQAAHIGRKFGVPVEYIVADLSTDEGIVSVENRLRGMEAVDLLINSAGFGTQGPFGQVSLEVERAMLRVHCEAVLRLSHAALIPMRARGRGTIVNVSSVAAFMPRGSYSASKVWLINFTQGVSAALEGSGVRLLALCPGFVKTDFHRRAGMRITKTPRFIWLEPDEIVKIAIRDLARGKTLCVPGLLFKMAVLGFRISPNMFPRFFGFLLQRFGPKPAIARRSQ
ncbi:SDR family NAD(P)-dependent oxidoreductase [Streptomyces chartreusis]|uniref:SDR family NAD(P)-dependent oxidoreductase n=1 Tax=Streptomyces chartreusis TaxID=1969 RepID=UPI0036ABB33D